MTDVQHFDPATLRKDEKAIRKAAERPTVPPGWMLWAIVDWKKEQQMKDDSKASYGLWRIVVTVKPLKDPEDPNSLHQFSQNLYIHAPFVPENVPDKKIEKWVTTGINIKTA